MKVGLNSYAFRWAVGTPDIIPSHPLSAFDVLDRARDLEVEQIELDANLHLELLDASDLARLRHAAAERGIVIGIGTVGMHPQRLARFLGIAHTLGSHHLRVHEDRKEWQPSVTDLIASIRTILPVCRRDKVVLAVENHFWYGAREIAEIVNTIDDPHVGVSLDTGNPVARLEGWRETVLLLAGRAVSLHLKDLATERRGVGFYASGRPLGKGIIDMRWVLARVRETGRNADVYLETWMDRAETEEATLLQETEWIRQSLDYARRLAADFNQ